jgi:hypothetical protein
MPIRMKLGTYEADEEGSSIFLIGKGRVLILGLLMVLPAVAAFWWSSGSHASAGLVAKRSSHRTFPSAASGEEAHRDPYPSFSSANWQHLEEGEPRPAPKSLDTDQACSEWEGRDVYRELKAMAVYEVTEDPERREEAVRPELLRSLSEGKK